MSPFLSIVTAQLHEHNYEKLSYEIETTYKNNLTSCMGVDAQYNNSHVKNVLQL